MPKYKDVWERIEARIVPVPFSGCWIWDSPSVSSGYGVLSVRGDQIGAHRAAYEHFHGPITNGLFVCHLCDVPLCVNPSHLYLATHAKNVADAADRMRFPKQRMTHCQNGHPLSGDNLYAPLGANGRVRRTCRACNRAAVARYKKGALA